MSLDSRARQAVEFPSQASSEQKQILDSFELAFGVTILVITAIPVVEEQFQGSLVGYSIGFYSSYGSFDNTDGHETIFRVLEWVFACVFVFEVCLRMRALGTWYWSIDFCPEPVWRQHPHLRRLLEPTSASSPGRETGSAVLSSAPLAH